MKGAAEITTE